MVRLAARFAWWSGLRSKFRFRQSLGRGNSPLSVRELRPHFPDSPGGPDGSWAPRVLYSLYASARSSSDAGRSAPRLGRLDDQSPDRLGRDVPVPAHEPELVRARARAGAVRGLPAAALAGSVGGAEGGIPGQADPLARRVGRLHGGLRDQQRVPVG